MQSLDVKLTHTYVGAYDYLDKWQYIGLMDEIGSRVLPLKEEDEEDMCEPRTTEFFVLVPLDKLDQGLHEQFVNQKLPDPKEVGEEAFDDALDYGKWLDRQIKRALYDTYTKWGCGHEYDCCGCRSFRAGTIERVTGDLWRVLVHSSRNY